MTLQVGVRVYANGEIKFTKRTPEGIHGWLEYNRSYRFGNALFVDGKLASPEDVGYLSPERIAQVERYLEANAQTLEKAEEDKFGPQVEPISAGLYHTYQGYCPERYSLLRIRWEDSNVSAA